MSRASETKDGCQRVEVQVLTTSDWLPQMPPCVFDTLRPTVLQRLASERARCQWEGDEPCGYSSCPDADRLLPDWHRRSLWLVLLTPPTPMQFCKRLRV